MEIVLMGWPLLPVHCVDDAYDLLDVLPFMASQPLRIEQHGPLEDLSRPRQGRRSFPAFGRQQGEDCQEIGTLRGKGAQRGPEFQVEIVRLLDPGAGIDSPQRLFFTRHVAMELTINGSWFSISVQQAPTIKCHSVQQR